LQHVFSDKVKVVNGDVIEGEGLVAVAQIAAGEAIWEPDHDARRRNTAEIAAVPPDNRHCQMGADLFVECLEPGSWAWNHSCSPDTFLKGSRQVAVCDLSEGDEITYDYGLHEIRWPWVIRGCRCGSAECRRTICNFDYLNARLLARWGEHVPDHVRRAAQDASWLLRLAYRLGVPRYLLRVLR